MAAGAGTVVTARTPAEWPWGTVSQLYAAIVALGLGYFIAGAPIQVSESLRNLLAVQRADLMELLAAQFTSEGFLRPLLLAQIDVAFEVSQGRYFAVFKTIHVVQVVLTGMLFVRLLRIRSPHEAAMVPFGIALLFGSHTFAGTLVEGFPINTFLTVVLCCLLAATLSDGAAARWRDVAAIVVFVFAALTVESGLLVWVCLAAAWIAGFRGVSPGALTATTGLLVAYLILRFAVLDVGAPALVERSSGYGFRVLDPPELVARFGDQPIFFYLYNVAAQVLTILFAEPKAGVWLLTRGVTQGDLMPRDVISVASQTGVTVLLAWYVGSRFPAWRRREVSPRDRWLLVALAVIAANAVISYPYTKNVIVSPAGAFYALAGALAFGAAIERMGSTARAAGLGVAIILALLSTGWAVRLVGVHYSLREKAFLARNDWTDVVLGQEPADVDPLRNPAAAALIRQLRDDAISRRVANPAFGTPAGWRYFEQPW
jgi:hypothetical protein